MHPAVWYRGWTAGVMMSVPMTVVQFGGASGFERAFLGFGDLVSPRSSGDPPPPPTPSLARSLASALLAGACSGALVQPLDVAMIQQQKFGGSLSATAARVTRSPAAWTRGVWLTIAREAFYSCGYLCAVPHVRAAAAPWFAGGSSEARLRGDGAAFAFAAVASGSLAAVVTQPLDVVKTIMQSNIGPRRVAAGGGGGAAARCVGGGGGGGVFDGLGYFETAATLAREEGARAFWRGLAPRGARIVGATLILSHVDDRAGRAIEAWREERGAGGVGRGGGGGVSHSKTTR